MFHPTQIEYKHNFPLKYINILKFDMVLFFLD